MKGAMPPEIIEKKEAGRMRRNHVLVGRSEKSSRMDGCGGGRSTTGVGGNLASSEMMLDAYKAPRCEEEDEEEEILIDPSRPDIWAGSREARGGGGGGGGGTRERDNKLEFEF